MSNEFFPTGRPELVEEVEVAQLQAENMLLTEAKFHDDLHIFRAEVFGRLEAHNALTDGVGWAIYYAGDRDVDSALEAGVACKEVLIYSNFMKGLDPQPNRDYYPTYIRVITNELVRFREGYAFLTEDFIADYRGYAQYFVDAINLKPNKKEKEQEAKSKAPIFGVNKHGGLGATLNTPARPLSFDVIMPAREDEATGTYASVRPYGDFASLEDNIHALAMAKNIFKEIEDLEPTHTATAKT